MKRVGQMRGLFKYAFIIAGVIISGSSSFALTKQYARHIYVASSEITEVSYLGSSYNVFFERNNEESLNSIAIIHFSHDKQYMDLMLNSAVTNMLEKSYSLYQLNLNEIYKYNNEWRIGEHSDRTVAILNYNRRIGPNTMLVIGFVHKQKLKRSKIAKTVGLGIHHQLTPLVVDGIGTGVGIDKEYPDFSATAAFQFSF